MRSTTVESKPRQLTCCCCGGDAGIFQQHYNRDTGYGMCADCIKWVRSRGETETEIRSLYGIEGINFASSSPNDAPATQMDFAELAI